MSNSTSVTVYDPERFVVAMPDNAPALGFDINSDTFNWRDVMPSNYFSMEELQEMYNLVGGWPVYTPARIVIKPVYDPSEFDGKPVPQSELMPKIVMEFEESAPALVFNKSRCDMATKATGTPDPRRWCELLGPVVLSVGVYNQKAQIIMQPMQAQARPNGKARPANAPKTTQRPVTVDAVNDELFS